MDCNRGARYSRNSSVPESARWTSSMTATSVVRAAARSNPSSIASNSAHVVSGVTAPGSARLKRRKSWRIGAYGRWANSMQSPIATRVRDFASARRSSERRRVFPTPASPPTSTRPPREASASRRHSCRYAFSRSRPMKLRQTSGRTITRASVREGERTRPSPTRVAPRTTASSRSRSSAARDRRNVRRYRSTRRTRIPRARA